MMVEVYILIQMLTLPPVMEDMLLLVRKAWTPDMVSDLVDGVNKFGTDWKRIKKEYNFAVTTQALQSRWYNVTRPLEDGKRKVVQQQQLLKMKGNKMAKGDIHVITS